jgi:type II secretory pathway component PulM
MIQSRLQALRDRYERLSQRERTMVGALGVTFILMITLIGGFFITDGLASLEERNSDARQALKDIESQRDNYLRARAKVNQLESKLGQQPIQLGGFLEQAAKDSGIQIPESNESSAPIGKQYTERAIDLRLTKVPLDALAQFLKRIESGPNLVVVKALQIRTRDDKHQELDVDMTVCTYEKSKAAPPKKGDKS